MLNPRESAPIWRVESISSIYITGHSLCMLDNCDISCDPGSAILCTNSSKVEYL